MPLPDGTLFWGKYLSETEKSLSLLAHSLDVAIVFRALCDLDGIKRSLAGSTRTSLTRTHLDRLAVLAMLHDIGKANLGFQDKINPGCPKHIGHVKELAPLFSDEILSEEFMNSLPRGIGRWFSSTNSADSYFFAIFSHHGRPIRFLENRSGNYWRSRNEWWQPAQCRNPIQAIAEISLFAETAFPHAFVDSTSPLPEEPNFHHRFAGLVMLADWLGSHSHWFPVQRVSAEERLEHDLEIAPKLLRAIGMDVKHIRPVMKDIGPDFESRFGLSPLPLQKLLNKIDPATSDNHLLIAESETGSGKTEAALNWFCKLFIAGKVDSLYFALPTRVAARELYQRINNYISTWFPEPDFRPVTLLAVPGYTQVDGYTLRELIPDGEKANLWHEDRKTLELERCWAGARPKRFLAATVAIGTIDQALLSVVQTAHAHLRSVCLDRSLLVVDEVHASDLYMSRLLRSLLAHHLGAGGFAMLLSATLGSRALNEYIETTGSSSITPKLSSAVKLPYPSLTLSDGKMLGAAPGGNPKKIYFETYCWAFCPEKSVNNILVPALKAGARVIVIMNTVARAIALLRAVETDGAVDKTWFFRCEGQICAHHGRYAPADREILDKTVSTRLGKGSSPGPILLVGTQTLEQSLDIDADLIVTDLAPSDVLLQRAGRLHRHNRSRPAEYRKARCVVLVPDVSLESALQAKGEVAAPFKKMGYGSVYEDLRSLELTQRTLLRHPIIVTPDDNRFFVEQSTHPDALGSLTGEKWGKHGHLIHGKGLAKKITASTISHLFDQYFGDIEFVEAGRAVSTRLGIDRIHFSMGQEVLSPFGNKLTEMVIPGHMVPDEIEDDSIAIKDISNRVITLQYQERCYQYSRYGLEEIT